MIYFTPRSRALLQTTVTKSLSILFAMIGLLAFSSVQAQWTKVVGLNVGNVISIAVDPNNVNNIYAGTDFITTNQASSGLYGSVDKGFTWNQVTATNLANRAVRSIAFSNSSGGTAAKMFVAVAKQGIFKSVDGGVTWIATQINAIPNSVDPQFLFHNIRKVAISNNVNGVQKVYALVTEDLPSVPNSAGIYASNDDGATWTKAYSAYDFTVSPFKPDIRDFRISQSNADMIYVSKESQGQFVKVTLLPNGGFTEEAANGLPTGPSSTLIDFVNDPLEPTKLYATAVTSDVNGFGGFFISGNSGTSWLNRGTDVKARLAVAKTATNTIKLYAIDSNTTTVSESTDGGFCWRPVGAVNTGGDCAVGAIGAAGLPGTRLNAITAASDGTIYVGGVDGLYVLNGDINTGPITVPQATPEILTMMFGQNTITGTLKGRAVNPLTDVLTYVVTQQGIKGRLTFNGQLTTVTESTNPAFTYTLNAGQSAQGTDVIRFKVRDSSFLESTEAILTINFQNTASPVANASFLTVPTTGTITTATGTATGLLSANKVAVTDTLTYIITQLPTKGLLRSNGLNVALNQQLTSPSFTFTSTAGQTGADLFKFKVRDNAVPARESLEATVSITIQAPNQTGNGTGVDLSVFSAFADKTTIGNSQNLRYTLQLRNEGTVASPAAVTLTSTQFPIGTQFVTTGIGVQIGCSMVSNVITCSNLGPISPAGSKSVILEITTPANLTTTNASLGLRPTFTVSMIGAVDTSNLNNSKVVNTQVSGTIVGTDPIALNTTVSVVAGTTQVSGTFTATPVANTDILTYILVSPGTQGVATFVSPSVTNANESTSGQFTYQLNANTTQTSDFITFQVRDNSGRISNIGRVTVALPQPNQNPGTTGDTGGSGGALNPLLLLLGLLLIGFRRKL